jgi:tRNA(fMet)-specific endonuclease VapC
VKYLLDTNILSDLVRRMPSPALLQRVALVPAGEQATSSITIGELHYGARRLVTGAELLISRIDTLLAGATILPFDADAARFYGEIRADLERAGTPIGDADMRIAAVARVHDLTVITANVRHFARVDGLPVENWLS